MFKQGIKNISFRFRTLLQYHHKFRVVLYHNCNFFRIARPSNGTFLYFDAKIYQHIPYDSVGTDAKKKPNNWDNQDM